MITGVSVSLCQERLGTAIQLSDHTAVRLQKERICPLLSIAGRCDSVSVKDIWKVSQLQRKCLIVHEVILNVFMKGLIDVSWRPD